LDNTLRDQFLLDPKVIFLNHGSFGACPIPVFETYQRWQLELERQPVEFLGRRYDDLVNKARETIGVYLKTNADNLIFVPNITCGLNMVARSLLLHENDEILTTDHEYGALDLTWQFVCKKTGARYMRHPIPLPITSDEAVVEAFWAQVTGRTRVIFLSHITSPTALILPVAEIVRRARQAGILTVIDGAHVPGQIPLDLTALDADFYSGNFHKWLCAPKGSGFLFVRPEHQHLIEPEVISWGWLEDGTFASRNQWQGTRDVAAYLSVPAAIEFQEANHWEEVRQHCHTLALETRQRIVNLTGLAAISPDTSIAQMFSVRLPPCDLDVLKRRLYDEYYIEVPMVKWNDSTLSRISIQGYNTREDTDRLLSALEILLPQLAQ
jgi:isopenicillin-N epimerase